MDEDIGGLGAPGITARPGRPAAEVSALDTRVGFGPRLGAFLIDGLVVVAGGVLAGGLTGAAIGSGAGAAGDERAAAFAATLGFLGGAVAGVYLIAVLYGLIEAFTGASPGKRALKLKIGLQDGRPAPVRVYVTRWAVKYAGIILWAAGSVTGDGPVGTLGALVGLVVFIGCLLVLGDRRQAFHDMAATTAVFRRADLR